MRHLVLYINKQPLVAQTIKQVEAVLYAQLAKLANSGSVAIIQIWPMALFLICQRIFDEVWEVCQWRKRTRIIVFKLFAMPKTWAYMWISWTASEKCRSELGKHDICKSNFFCYNTDLRRKSYSAGRNPKSIIREWTTLLTNHNCHSLLFTHRARMTDQ